jgi:endonuclease YncB( thermonuclease family)
MSRHWKPPGKIVRMRPVGDWSRIQSYRRLHRSMPEGAKAGLVLVGAACVGIAIAAYQVLGPRHPIADEVAAVQPSETVRESSAPECSDSDADAEWAARAEGNARPSTHSGRTAVAGVRAGFGYCKWGGGVNCVVDGDTFYIGGAKVRIAGIDAPETHDYRCRSELELGERAARDLQALLNSGAVTMTPIDRDRDVYGRLLRNVSVDGRDVGEALIADGVARAYAGGRRPWC